MGSWERPKVMAVMILLLFTVLILSIHDINRLSIGLGVASAFPPSPSRIIDMNCLASTHKHTYPFSAFFLSNFVKADDANDSIIGTPLFGDRFESLEDSVSDKTWLEALKEREEQLRQGIGKRYITRTQKGFLNVHEKPGDPYDIENIVNQLTEGEIVTSIASQEGNWVCHDKGGWSISKYEGFTWLEPIEE
ncbi:hypothetical protein IV203_017142 [Nitzschia inconspicua]|uniref:Uncharacterized protein n=1 Tax=Nitzschia inconspicua TaxID=303405 RepID=A0A9K3KR87_9STRA|nr:hypothetical protein IV203_017142 [Nitzschia inconspicua]